MMQAAAVGSVKSGPIAFVSGSAQALPDAEDKQVSVAS
jgi:hypothetical protein